MSLFDLFFPAPSLPHHLYALRAKVERRARRDRRRRSESDRKLQELREEVGFLAILLGALVEKLDERGVVTRADLRSILSEIDSLDGVANGKLDVRLLEKLTTKPRLRTDGASGAAPM